jgi:hypothetical protein
MPTTPARPPATDAAPSAHRLPLSRIVALVIALISWFALLAQVEISMARSLANGRSILDSLAHLSFYLTNLTTLLGALCFSALAWPGHHRIGHFFRQPQVSTAVTAYSLFVGIAYNLLLRHLWHPEGFRALVDESLHTILPLLVMGYWLLFVPCFASRMQQQLLWLVYPLTYLGVTFWRGSSSGFYPYPFVNVRQLGYPHVLLNASGLLAGFIALMLLLLLINRSGKVWLKRVHER